MNRHDDHLDALTFGMGLTDTPVWYVMRNFTEIVAVIQLATADTMSYRYEGAKYPDCLVWCHVMFGWAYMDTNKLRSSIWQPAIPPDVLLMAKLLEN